jgi:hypothetical protein
VVEYSSSKHETLSSIHSTANQREREERREEAKRREERRGE